MANQTFLPPLDFTPRQERVLALLRLVGPGPAAFFRDALRLIRARESLEAATHLAGHCFREIESALRDVLLPDGLSAEEAKKGRGQRDSHRREVMAILGAYGIDHADKVASKWLRIADNEDEDGLFRAARPPDDRTSAFIAPDAVYFELAALGGVEHHAKLATVGRFELLAANPRVGGNGEQRP